MEKRNFIQRIFGGKQTPETPTKRTVKKQANRRDFHAARLEATLADWAASGLNSIDKEIENDLSTLRTRSRDCVQNNPYGKRYVQVLEDQIVGAHGISLKMNVQNRDGSRDVIANENIEADWKAFSKEVTTSGLNFRQLLAIAIKTVATDGEMFLVKRQGKDFGKFFVQYQIFESDWVPHRFNQELGNGRFIRNGIEYNPFGKATAYYVVKQHVKEQSTRPAGYNTSDMIRFPAEEVIHLYEPTRASQGRGFPWLTQSLRQLQHLKEYTESEQVAARVSAAKMGFYTRKEGDDGLDTDENEYASGGFAREVVPGSFEELPEGYSMEMFNPTHPNGNFAEFQKSILHSVASALGISYMTLSTDIGSANYSSARIGTLHERETFSRLQQWMIEGLVTPIFEAFLSNALEFQPGALTLPADRFDKFNAPKWRPRTWVSVDPAKETQATKTQLAENLISRSEVIRQSGRDPDQVFAEIAEENEKARKLGIALEPTDEPTNSAIKNGKEPDTDDEDE